MSYGAFTRFIRPRLAGLWQGRPQSVIIITGLKDTNCIREKREIGRI